ncbi:CpsD/CapB family tyrosine-protein kinase [bacterium]|nr:CpsD/CapB family tyrosine-protein kinase [bacterium]
MSKISKAMDRADREERRGQDVGGPAAGGEIHDGPRQTEESEVVTPRERRAPVRTARAVELPESIEEYHGLASEIYMALPDIPSRIIMVVSAVEGEGTSTVAREFAHSVAVSNEIDTLLVDGNLRRPQHHKVLRASQDPGLTDLVLSGAAFDSCLRSVGIPHLVLMPAGRRVIAPPRIFTDPGLDAGLQECRRRFKLTVIDAPPLLAFSEAIQLSRKVDGVVLVVRAGHTKRQLVEVAVDRLNDAGANVIGTVLNRRKFYIPPMIYERL